MVSLIITEAFPSPLVAILDAPALAFDIKPHNLAARSLFGRAAESLNVLRIASKPTIDLSNMRTAELSGK